MSDTSACAHGVALWARCKQCEAAGYVVHAAQPVRDEVKRYTICYAYGVVEYPLAASSGSQCQHSSRSQPMVLASEHDAAIAAKDAQNVTLREQLEQANEAFARQYDTRAALQTERDLALAKLAGCERDAGRLHKLFHLAAHDVIFFSSYDERKDLHEPIESKFYTPCVNFNDTFAYACADGERLPDDQIDILLEVFKRFGNTGVIAWGSKQRGCDPLPPLINDEYHAARRYLDAAEKIDAALIAGPAKAEGG